MDIIKFISPVRLTCYNEEDEEVELELTRDRVCAMNGTIHDYEEPAPYDGIDLARGLIAYTNSGEHAFVNKIMTARVSIQEINDHVVAVCTCAITRQLTTEETEDFIDWLVGQNSDGWGEGLEQQVVYLPGLYGHIGLWFRDPDWKIVEYNPTKEMEKALLKAREILDSLK